MSKQYQESIFTKSRTETMQIDLSNSVTPEKLKDISVSTAVINLSLWGDISDFIEQTNRFRNISFNWDSILSLHFISHPKKFLLLFFHPTHHFMFNCKTKHLAVTDITLVFVCTTDVSYISVMYISKLSKNYNRKNCGK